MLYATIRRLVTPLKRSPLHPQWFVYRKEQKRIRETAAKLRGTVLDIGCADKRLKHLLPKGCEYIGLDYYLTATERYRTVPDIFGDAQLLPFANSCMDSVVLLDVLEHLPEPGKCLAEIARVLKSGGRFVLQVPFIYPIHDAPFDFQRWTAFGLRHLVMKHGFTVTEESSYDQPAETAALIGNIALAKIAVNLTAKRHPAILLFPCLVLAIPFSICWDGCWPK